MAEVQNACCFMHFWWELGNVLTSSELESCTWELFSLQKAYSAVISLVYFALRQCFTCYVSSRGNAGAHKFLWAALFFFPLEKSCNLWTAFFFKHRLELVSSLEKATGTFLTATCHQKIIVIPSYWLIKTAIKCVGKVVLCCIQSCKIEDVKRRKWLHSYWRAETEVSSSWKVPAQVKTWFLHWELWKGREGVPHGRSWWPLSAGTGSPCASFVTSLAGTAHSLRWGRMFSPVPALAVWQSQGWELGSCPQNPTSAFWGSCALLLLPDLGRSGILHPWKHNVCMGGMWRGKFVKAVQCSWGPVIPLCPETSP